ncbi:PREDICTED: Fc receptor-like protein 6 [Ceratotherium simum simum]|uniref:Fc receptor-like protein 6 n=1 Tax=Ceratotherium simum simum TaxID=73337 RepID=A0ABM1DL31_CERSS|nr:PREDICTED: Fc receptor-like protein 6 [Ceratotherium simum simum]
MVEMWRKTYFHPIAGGGSGGWAWGSPTRKAGGSPGGGTFDNRPLQLLSAGQGCSSRQWRRLHKELLSGGPRLGDRGRKWADGTCNSKETLFLYLTVRLNLQARPNPVFEGDILTLRCQGMRNTALSQVKFFKDGKFLQFSVDNNSLLLGTATVKDSGQYTCTGHVKYNLFMTREGSGTTLVQVQELFLPPVLSAIPSPEPHEGSPVTLRCQTKLHPQRSSLQLFFSFHKEGQILQDRGLHPELCIPEAQEGDSGLYGCEVAPEGGQIQKQSPQLEIRVWVPVSPPLLTLSPGPTRLTVGDMVELLCEAQRGSPPILYSFYLDGKILGNHSAPHGGATSLLFPVTSEQDAGNYSCEAENSVSKESSAPKTLSLDGPLVLSTPTISNWLVPLLPASLLGVMVIAAALLGYFRPWRKTGPLPSQNLPPAPGGEQHPLYAEVHYQNEKDEGVIYASGCTNSKSEARPAESTSREEDSSIIYAEVKRPQLCEVPVKRPTMRSRTHKDPLGDREEVFYY